jgi:hypothetical protein
MSAGNRLIDKVIHRIREEEVADDLCEMTDRFAQELVEETLNKHLLNCGHDNFFVNSSDGTHMVVCIECDRGEETGLVVTNFREWDGNGTSSTGPR